MLPREADPLLAFGPIHQLYREHVPRIMQRKSSQQKSVALAELAADVFGDAAFDTAKVRLGIVATHWTLEKPFIFKSDAEQAHGRVGTFVPGFGVKLGDAVQASCSAYPFFDRKIVRTDSGRLHVL